jgi:hypothetical protein|tara:strand:+ start:78 stop:317 length:240 start_codon:yes stop_codon:yes gene_type:complete
MNQHTFSGWKNKNRQQGYKKSFKVNKNEKFYSDVERLMKRRELTRSKAIEVVEGWRMKDQQSKDYRQSGKKRKKNKVQP